VRVTSFKLVLLFGLSEIPVSYFTNCGFCGDQQWTSAIRNRKFGLRCLFDEKSLMIDDSKE
jgi:hypothetical protein